MLPGSMLNPKHAQEVATLPLSRHFPNTNLRIHPPTTQTNSTTPLIMAASFNTATLSPLFAMRVNRPMLLFRLVPILLNASFVLSSVVWSRALSYMFSVMCLSCEDFAWREERRALFCLLMD